MLEFVELLLHSCDNLIDQLILLREFKHHKEVKKYIRTLEKENISPYERYCINKFFYGLDVEAEKIPDFYYPMLPTNGHKYIKKLIGDISNIRDQVIKLKKYKDKKEVIIYTEEVFPYFIETNPYARNIILKNYYDVPCNELPPDEKSLHIRLDSICFQKLLMKQERKRNKIFKKSLRRVKVGDKVRLCSGPFKGLEGVVLEKGTDVIKVELDLFGMKTPCDFDWETKFKKVKNK